MLIPEDIFRDQEDGSTFNLRLSISSLDSNAKQYFALGDRNITGIPMKSGEFNFRLEARDKNDQVINF